jgi:phosphatidylinositol-3-phosphatase
MKTAFRPASRRLFCGAGALAILSILVVTLAIDGSRGLSRTHAQEALPAPSHVVLVIEENHSFNEIIGSSSAPYMNALASMGAVFTQSFAVTHPSEPNYLALFSGSTQGIADDSCPHSFSPPDLGGELIQAGLSFGGYAEDLPSIGSTVCNSGEYARKHNPWADFTDVPASDNMPFTSFPTTDFSSLPTVSIVVPNLLDDMHDGTIQQGDSWLQQNIDPYVQWAQTNNSLLIVTWDEDDSSQSNQIPTLFVGPMVQPGQYDEQINHYNVLRTLEDMYGLPAANNSANVSAITDCWQTVSTPTPGLTPTPTPGSPPTPMASTLNPTNPFKVIEE